MDAQTTSLMIAGIGALIAILALITSIASLYVQRKHNKLSAKPLLDVTLGRDAILLEINNFGLGPALIHSIRANADGADLDLMTDEGLTQLSEFLVRVTGRTMYVTPLKLVGPSPLLPSRSKPLITLRPPFSTSELDSIRLKLRSISIVIKCKCIYQDKHTFEHKREELTTTSSS